MGASSFTDVVTRRPDEDALTRRKRLMRETSVYRTASGMIFRLSTGEEASRAVETLTGAGWMREPSIVGLRVAPDTVRHTARQVLALPS